MAQRGTRPMHLLNLSKHNSCLKVQSSTSFGGVFLSLKLTKINSMKLQVQ